MIKYTDFSRYNCLSYCLSLIILISCLPGGIISQGLSQFGDVKIQMISSLYFIIVLALSIILSGKRFWGILGRTPDHIIILVVVYLVQILISSIFHDILILATVILQMFGIIVYVAAFRSIKQRIFLNTLYFFVLSLLVIFAINLLAFETGRFNPFDEVVTENFYYLKDNMRSYDYFYGLFYCLIAPLNLLNPDAGNFLLYFNEPHNLHFFLLPSLLILWHFQYRGYKILTLIYTVLYFYSVSITTLIVCVILLLLVSYQSRIIVLLSLVPISLYASQSGLIRILLYKLFDDNSSLLHSVERQRELYFSFATVGEGVWMIDMLDGEGAGMLTSILILVFVLYMIIKWFNLHNNTRLLFMAFGYILMHGLKIYNAFYTTIYPILMLSIILDLSTGESIKNN